MADSEDTREDLADLIRRGAATSPSRVPWSVIKLTPAYKLQEAVALSLGLWPGLGDLEWAEDQARFINELRNNPFFPKSTKAAFLKLAGVDEDDPSLDISWQLMMRLKVAAGNIKPYGDLPVLERYDDALLSTVRLADFAAWAEGQGWTLPPEFPNGHTANEQVEIRDPRGRPRQTPDDLQDIANQQGIDYFKQHGRKPLKKQISYRIADAIRCSENTANDRFKMQPVRMAIEEYERENKQPKQ